jgi:hypothetical protein
MGLRHADTLIAFFENLKFSALTEPGRLCTALISHPTSPHDERYSRLSRIYGQ